mmetsp:Transcript_22087/g.47643  ORF Transcript_22087/g.47643 Transcript_22087/m.47643 type:complete len:205 (-) Transcript_22087:125-739(-)
MRMPRAHLPHRRLAPRALLAARPRLEPRLPLGARRGVGGARDAGGGTRGRPPRAQLLVRPHAPRTMAESTTQTIGFVGERPGYALRRWRDRADQEQLHECAVKATLPRRGCNAAENRGDAVEDGSHRGRPFCVEVITGLIDHALATDGCVRVFVSLSMESLRHCLLSAEQCHHLKQTRCSGNIELWLTTRLRLYALQTTFSFKA